MPSSIGYAFAPGADANMQQGQAQGGGRPDGLSPQAAVRLLQLRVPERPAAGGIAPQALLTGQGGAGIGGGGELQAIIQALMRKRGMGGDMAAFGGELTSAMGGGGGSGLPTPHVWHGIDGGALPTPRITVGQGAPGSTGEPLPTIQTVSRPPAASRPIPPYLRAKQERLDASLAPPLF